MSNPAEPASTPGMDPSAVQTVADLATALRNLRRREARARSGRELTYRQIADRTGWSVSMIGSYFTGTIVAPTDRFDVLVELLGAPPDEARVMARARDRVAEVRRRAESPASPAEPAPPPRELPAAPTHFVGREKQQEQLRRIALGDPAGDPTACDPSTSRETSGVETIGTGTTGVGTTGFETTVGEGEVTAGAVPPQVPIVVITGMAGVGKTALALQWAHRWAPVYTAGNLYLDLRGYDTTEPLDPSDALAGLLHSLGLDDAQIPLDLSARAARYRTMLAGHRYLVLLDNVRNADQVRPLIPGEPRCAVVVTSRDSLAGLVSTSGATRVPLEPLTQAESADLLRRLLGDRVDDEPDAAAALAAYCGQLPLTIRVAAEIAAQRGGDRLSDVVADLRETRQRLDVLDTGEVHTTIRSVLSWSYRALSVEAARVFRLVGALPTLDLGVAALGSLAGRARAQVERSLTELVRAHLLVPSRPGHHRMHDLVHDYADELARVEEDEGARAAAVRRFLDHLLHTAVAADRLLQRSRYPIPLAPPVEGAVVEVPGSVRDALSWFEAERATLLTATRLAAELGWRDHAWQLPWACANFLERAGLWQELAAASAVALDITTDPAALARIHGLMTRAASRLDLFDVAFDHDRAALAIWERLGDDFGQAAAHSSLASLHDRVGRLAEAAYHCERAHTLYGGLGHTAAQAAALNNLGHCRAGLGDHEAGLAACRASIALCEPLDDRGTMAYSWGTLGMIYREMAALAESVDAYHRAARLFREVGDRFNEATMVDELAVVYQALGDADLAADCSVLSAAIVDGGDEAPARARLGLAIEQG
jgi:tetratricopeptide (TPR) repeat protein